MFGLIAPQALIRPFGIRSDSGEARAEVRAAYGGFGVAMAGVLVCAAIAGGGVRDGAVMAVAAALGGMAFGRLVARTADRPARFYPVWDRDPAGARSRTPGLNTLAFALGNGTGCDPSWGGTVAIDEPRIVDDVHRLQVGGGR